LTILADAHISKTTMVKFGKRGRPGTLLHA